MESQRRLEALVFFPIPDVHEISLAFRDRMRLLILPMSRFVAWSHNLRVLIVKEIGG
ncbi:MAG: hypothetical protein RMY34_18395 [Aulosira sp. DedQUE10]|nr:hypothetical protein [Aulosira sp. DedQUE10]